MDQSHLSKGWWKVIEALAQFIAAGYDYEDLEDEFIRFALKDQGFSNEDFEGALDWLENASVCGSVADVFSMLLTKEDMPVRVDSPLEQACFSDKTWLQFQKMRFQGILPDDTAERLIEGLRNMDTRDWEDEDHDNFLYEVVAASLPNRSEKMVRKLISQKATVPEFYS